MKNILFILISCCIISSGFTQETLTKDKAVYKEAKNGFYQDSVLNKIQEYEAKKNAKEKHTYLSVDFSGKKFPTDPGLYKQVWHNDPVSQGNTGTCWSFASTSFIESEIYRITGQKIKLSEMYFVYWQYVEKARYFVNHHGDMFFGEGSEVNATPEMIKLHGAVPLGAYSGKLFGQKVYNHEQMFAELDSYLKKVKENNAWNEDVVVSTVRQILDYYMGRPPDVITIDKVNYTPKDYAEKVLQVRPDDYFNFMSTESLTYDQRGMLDEPDNWWRSNNYYNVKLNDFTGLAKDALANGYFGCVCGDVSEPGYDKYAKVGIIPSFDIPSGYIDADAREYRLNNKITFDDHCLHIIGYTEKEGKTWFMLKDSGSGGFDAEPRGYRFISEDYFRLKIISLMVYKEAARKVLDRIIK